MRSVKATESVRTEDSGKQNPSLMQHLAVNAVLSPSVRKQCALFLSSSINDLVVLFFRLFLKGQVLRGLGLEIHQGSASTVHLIKLKKTFTLQFPITVSAARQQKHSRCTEHQTIPRLD